MILIRDASPHDVPTIVDFQLRMALETENITLEIGVLEAGVRQLLRDPSKGKYYVAQVGDEVVGCLMTTYEWSDWREGTVLWIQSVYVSEKFRGQAVYRKLYEHIMEFVKQDYSLKGIRLYVDRKNKDAQEVYKKLGMNGDHYQVYEWMKK